MKEFQVQAIREVVEGEKDVFINMPTGYGKSLTYQALPIMFDCVRRTNTEQYHLSSVSVGQSYD